MVEPSLTMSSTNVSGLFLVLQRLSDTILIKIMETSFEKKEQ